MRESVIEKLAAKYVGRESAGKKSRKSEVAEAVSTGRKASSDARAAVKAARRGKKSASDSKAVAARDQSGAKYLRKRRRASFAAQRRAMGDQEWHSRNAAWAKKRGQSYTPRGKNRAGYEAFEAKRSKPLIFGRKTGDGPGENAPSRMFGEQFVGKKARDKKKYFAAQRRSLGKQEWHRRNLEWARKKGISYNYTP